MHLKHIHTFSPLALALILSACGGGGGSSSSASSPTSSTTPTPAPSPRSGSVTAPFVGTSSATYLVLGMGSILIGHLPSFTQDSSGAMTTLNDVTLTGTQTQVKDINGDADYAQGRWTIGTVNYSGGVLDQMDGNSNVSYHYLATNGLNALPTSGSKTCDSGRFTAPSYTGGSNITSEGYFGVATGSATLTFDTDGAHAAMAVNATAGSDSGSTSVSGVLATPDSYVATGNFYNGSAGGIIMIADGGNGTVIVYGGFRVGLSNGGKYLGVASFRCS